MVRGVSVIVLELINILLFLWLIVRGEFLWVVMMRFFLFLKRNVRVKVLFSFVSVLWVVLMGVFFVFINICVRRVMVLVLVFVVKL